jgi:uncharacterized membrane protein
MVLFYSSRLNQNWSKSEIRNHFLIRGWILIGLQLVLNLAQIWSVGGSPAPLYYIGVLAALGAGMILGVPLLYLKPGYLLLIGTILFIGLELLTPDPGLWGNKLDDLIGTLLIYSGGGNEYWVNYPLLAWLEIAVFGMAFGKYLLVDRNRTFRAAGITGVFLLAGFVGLRLINGFGTIRPLPLRDWMDFLSVVKYPPSMAFILLTMGVNLLFLDLFSRGRRFFDHDLHPLLVLGRVPLFSYLTHLVIYAIMGRFFTPDGTSLPRMYIFWVMGLAALYFPALWYGRYKSGQPARSWVRLF